MEENSKKIKYGLNKLSENDKKISIKSKNNHHYKTPEIKSNNLILELKSKYDLKINNNIHKKRNSHILNMTSFKKDIKISKGIKEKINNIEKFFKENKINNNFNNIFTKLNHENKQIKEESIFINNSLYNHQEMKKDINYILNKKGDKLNFIDIDLFLQYLCFNKPFYDNEEDNNNLIEGFCLQHRAFIFPEVLINKIISCFDYYYPKEKPFGLIEFLYKYINLHNNYDLGELSENIITKINDFLKKLKNIEEIKNKNEELIQLIEIELKEYESSKQQFNPNKKEEQNEIKEIISLSDKSSEEDEVNKDSFVDIFLKDAEIISSNKYYFDILKYKSKDISSELTRIKYNLFCKIEVKEFLKGGFNSKDKLIKSPNICQIISRFNNLSSWVIEEILSYDQAKMRAKIIKKFIHICSALKKLGNFDDLFAILSSLTNFNIKNLGRTWKKISKKDMDIFRSLSKILRFENNWKKLRNEIDKRKNEKLFYLPYLGFYTKRILFLEEIGPYVKSGSSLINVEKICEIYKILKEFYEFKNIKNFGYSCQNQIIKDELLILQYLEPSDENKLIEIAKQLEPKFILSKKKSETKRPTKTDINFFSNISKQNNYI